MLDLILPAQLSPLLASAHSRNAKAEYEGHKRHVKRIEEVLIRHASLFSSKVSADLPQIQDQRQQQTHGRRSSDHHKH